MHTNIIYYIHLLNSPFSAPTDIVDNITVERNDNNTFLIIQWEPYRASDGNEVPMAMYEIEYRRFGSGDPANKEVIRGNRTLGIIGGLSNAANYEVKPNNLN